MHEGFFGRNIKYYITNPMNEAYSIIKNEGFSCLYNGLSSALTGQILCNAIYFGSYNYFKELLINLRIKDIVTYSIVTSLFASLTTSILTHPLWVLNSRMSKSKETVLK